MLELASPCTCWGLSMNWVSDFQWSVHDSGWDLRMWVFLSSEIGAQTGAVIQ